MSDNKLYWVVYKYDHTKTVIIFITFSYYLLCQKYNLTLFPNPLNRFVDLAFLGVHQDDHGHRRHTI